MSEISKLLQDRVGLTAEQAESAENVVLEFVRSRIPAQYQGLLDTLIAPQSATPDGDKPSGDALGGFGGLIGAAEGIFSGQK